MNITDNRYKNRNFEDTFGCFAEIDEAALYDNFRAIAKGVSDRKEKEKGKTDVMAVVKADAYGHGIDICAPVLYRAGCRNFAVATLEEAFRLYDALPSALGCRILILERIPSEYAPLAATSGFTLSVFSEEYANKLESKLRSCGKKVKIHLKLDTGMNRKGLSTSDGGEKAAKEIKRTLAACPSLVADGIFTHLYDTANIQKCRAQLERFRAVLSELDNLKVSYGTRHVCASGGTFLEPALGGEYLFDLVRIGVAIYGYGPCAASLGLKPVMRFYGTVESVHTVKAGETVSYFGEFKAVRGMTVATVCGGYADGIMRAYTGASVGLPDSVSKDGGMPCAEIVGRICMDAFMIAPEDGASVKCGDRVLIFGDTAQRLEGLARHAGTIEYECMCAAGHCRGKRHATH